MKVTNISNRPIYIGAVKILPDQTENVADALKSSPVIAALIEHNEIKVGGNAGKPPKAPGRSNKNNDTTGGQGTSEGSQGGSEDGKDKSDGGQNPGSGQDSEE